MSAASGPQTVESIVAFWICIPIVVIAGLVLIVAVISAIQGEDGAISATVGCLLVCAALIGGYVWGMYPDDYAHHHWQRYSGVVATMTPTFENAYSTGLATFTAEPDRSFYIRDARIVAVRPGQTLTVDCVQRYSGAGGMDWPECKWVAVN